MTSPTAITEGTRVGALPGVLLLACSCLSVLAAVLLTPVLPLMEQQFPGSPLPVPLVLSAPALMIAVFSPFAGQIADRVGRRALLLVTTAIYAVVGTAPAWLPAGVVESAIFPLLLLRLLVGVCEAAIMTCCTTLLADYYQGSRRNRYLGLQTVFTTIAAVVFIAVGGAVGGSGWRAPFWVYALALVVLVPMLFVIREPRRTEVPIARAARRPVPWAHLSLPLVVTVFGGLAFFILLAESALVYAGIGVTATQTIGLLSAIAAIATAIGSILFPRLVPLTAKVLLPLAFGALGVGLVVVWICAGAQSVAGVAIGAVIGSFGSGLLLPTLLVWAVGRLHFEERGRSTGLWTAAFFLGQFASPLVVQALEGSSTAVGALATAIGSIGVACIVVGAALGIGVRRAPLGDQDVPDELVALSNEAAV